MSKIFISYRHEDSADVTGRLYDRLTYRFGRDRVIRDVDSIPLGVDFRDFLTNAVGDCRVFLAVIGTRWLDARNEAGQRRLDDPHDFVRIEIEAALRREIPVIPVLVQGCHIPARDRLPAALKGLVYRNGIAIRPDPDFAKDARRLIRSLKPLLGTSLTGEAPHPLLQCPFCLTRFTGKTMPHADILSCPGCVATFRPPDPDAWTGGHRGIVRAVAVSPCGQLSMSGGWDTRGFFLIQLLASVR